MKPTFIENSRDNAGVLLGTLSPGAVFRVEMDEPLSACCMVVSFSIQPERTQFVELSDGTVADEGSTLIVYPTPIEIHHARKPRA